MEGKYKKKKKSNVNNIYDVIDIQNKNNSIINIKHATVVNDTYKLLPGLTESYMNNTYEHCELCWNCCHSFNNPATSIPMKYMDNIFYIYGYFCSYNCGARYIFDTFNDKNKWNVYSLLNLYYNILGNTTGKHVNPYPNKLMLNKFGGKMNIDEYRSSSSLYGFILPPIIPVDHTIKHISDNISQKENKEMYKLCRKNAINTKNNIYDTMNLGS